MEPVGGGADHKTTHSQARIVHRSHGRLRLRVAGHRRDKAYFDHIARRLNTIPGVSAVSSNAETGSILIHHDPDAGAAILSLFEEGKAGAIALIREQGLVLRSISDGVDKGVRGLDQALRRSTGNQLNLRLSLAFLFLLMATLQVARKEFRASTVHLLLSALQAAAHGRRHEAGDVAKAIDDMA